MNNPCQHLYVGNDCPYCKVQYGQYINYSYTYKCPDCEAEFNQPVFKINQSTTTTFGKYHCPFCNLEMKGLN